MSKELDYIADLEKENRLLGEHCNQLLKDKGDLTDHCQRLIDQYSELFATKEQLSQDNSYLKTKIKSLEEQIADIKANCDLAIEGRDIKIKELKEQIEKMKRHCNCKHRDSEGYCEVKRIYLIDLSYDGCDKWELED